MSVNHDRIRILGARRHNLRDVDLEIPRRTITVVTGVSGSGKSSLVFGTVAAEAQRQVNETYPAFVRNRLPRLGRPDVDVVENLSPVIVVDQRRLGANARSTVATATDIAPLLRLLFSRAGTPRLGESSAFSFNEPAGMCPRCSGLGVVLTPDTDAFVDDARTLEQGAIRLPGFGANPEQARYWYRKLTDTGCFDVDRPLRDWPREQRDRLLHGDENHAVEGLLPHFTRIYLQAEGEMSARKQRVVERFTTSTTCPDCDGERLTAAAREVRIGDATLPQWTATEVVDLIERVTAVDAPGTAPVVTALVERLSAMVEVGLGHLTLDRATGTLSGGESQRVKTVRHLASSLTEMLVVFDEPSVGLHPRDVTRLLGLLRRLRDKGHTVLVVEHSPDVIAAADHVVDLGPGPGREGGSVLFSGPHADFGTADTPTARALRTPVETKAVPRTPTGGLEIVDARRNTLQGLTLTIPTGVLTAVTGVAGSGKSSLVAELLAQHPGGVRLDQSGLRANRRSTLATYTGVADVLRRRYARALGVPAARFSANSDGACGDCDGLGVIHTDLAFLEGVTTPCATCGGRRFTDEVLALRIDGRSIADVLDLTVGEAATDPAVSGDGTEAVLAAMVDVGLDHLALGRPLTTLSGGEGQRLRLAIELAREPATGLYVLDEPTTGLHRTDVARLVTVLDRLVEDGHTVVVVEHDPDLIRRVDHVVELGPGAGRHGGRLLRPAP